MSKDSPRRPANETDARQAIARNPHSALAYYNLGLLLTQDPARSSETEAAYRTAVELEPDNPRYIYRLGLFLHDDLQRFAEAEIAYHQALALAPDNPFFYGGLVSLLVQLSRRAEALALSLKMRALLNAQQNWYGLATLDAILGNLEAAIGYLRQAASRENFNREWAQKDPDLAAIRNDPRFGEIVSSVQ